MTWKFDQAPNVACLATRSIVAGGPVLVVTHYGDDCSWGFTDGAPATAAEAMIVTMSEVLDLHPDLLEIADLPPGWTARRLAIGSPWARQQESQVMDPSQAARKGRTFAFFQRRPALLLVTLSLTCAEYINSSSPISALLQNPFLFAFQLIANLGLYGPGVLLAREALVRWKKGWASALVLGAAYGIFEEGIALATIFNPASSAVKAVVGSYGWWGGVNWVWGPAMLLYHAIISITLPILLLDLAVPEKKGESLVGRKALCLLGMASCVTAWLLIHASLRLSHYFMGAPKLLGAIGAIIALVALAYALPARTLAPRTLLPIKPPWLMAVLGCIGMGFFPLMLLAAHLNLRVWLVLLVMGALESAVLVILLGWIGRSENRRQLIAFGSGLLVPNLIVGIISQIAFPLVLLVDIAFGLFLLRLWRSCAGSPYPAPEAQLPMRR